MEEKITYSIEMPEDDAAEEIKNLKKEIEQLKAEKEQFFNYYLEYFAKATKYENAFKAVIEEIRK